MLDEIGLLCLVHGNDLNHVFLVRVDPSQKVHELKKAILADLLLSRHLVTSDLTCWKFELPLEGMSDDTARKINLENGQLIRPWARISEIWPTAPPEDTLNVILRPPSTTISPTSSMHGEWFSSEHPSSNHLSVMLSTSEIPRYSSQWIALKRKSRFSKRADPTKDSDGPCAGGILHCASSMLTMMMVEEPDPILTIYIRDCYLTWFQLFCRAVEKRPTGKFALSSSPGCGKTFSVNLIFKLASSTPNLYKKPVLYQYRDTFSYFQSDKVFHVTRENAVEIAMMPEIFYILDGQDADPVGSTCLTLFISSPLSKYFKNWHYHAKTAPRYFPVWTLDELQECRTLCYPTYSEATVNHRYQEYGGIARYVFWPLDEPLLSVAAPIVDGDARRSIQSIQEPSYLFPSSHMLLHISIDENMHFKQLVLASRYVGHLLFSKYFQETADKMKEFLGAGGALAGHLFECYVHFLFEHGQDQPLRCRSLEGDNSEFELNLRPRKIEVFNSIPSSLLDDYYYVPLSSNFAAVDGLIKEVAVQCTVTNKHPIKGVEVVRKLAALYPDHRLPLVFIVPESIADEFTKQPILTTAGKEPEMSPSIHQYVAGLPLGINTSTTKKRRIMSP